MRKHTQRRFVSGLTPYEKAVVRHAWDTGVVNASIHAYIGDDLQELTQQVGGIVYAVLTACEEAGIQQAEPDVQRLQDAGRAILELAAQPAIDSQRRNRLVEGLAASERLKARLTASSLHRAVLDLSQAKQKSSARSE